MICIYQKDETQFDDCGLAVLSPSTCIVREIAGGGYELHLEHPMDEAGKFMLLAEDMIIKSPVPKRHMDEITLPNMQQWTTNKETSLYSTLPKPTSPKKGDVGTVMESPSTYAWVYGRSYKKGALVVWNSVIYRSRVDQYGIVMPGTNSSVWSYVCRVDATQIIIPGSVIETIPANTVVFFVSDYSDTYVQVRTAQGKIGYVKRSDVDEGETGQSGLVIPAHDITEQLFRIYDIQCEEDTGIVSVDARHISYDFMGNSLYECKLEEASVIEALARLQGGLMEEDTRNIYCNIETNKKINADWSFKNPVNALLGQDDGLVPTLDAMLIRENEDYYILDNSSPKKGITLQYGRNLVGVRWGRTQGVITRIVPRANNGKEGYLYLDDMFVDSPLIADYPKHKIECLNCNYTVGQKYKKPDGTEATWDIDSVKAQMLKDAQERFTKDKVDQIAVTLEVEFVLLGDTEEYKQYKGLQSVNLYDEITVNTGRSGMTSTAQVTEYEYDCILMRYNNIKIGKVNSFRRVPGYRVTAGSIGYSKLAPELVQLIQTSGDSGSDDSDNYMDDPDVPVDPNQGSYTLPDTWKPNTKDQEGYVTAGNGNNNKVWATNGSGEPAWRNPGAYTLPLAADGTRGGVQIGYTQSGKNYPVQLDGEKMFVNVPWTDHYAWDDITGKPATATRWPTWDEVTGKPGSFYTLPLAADGTRGGVQVGYTTSGKNYAVQLSGEKMYVNVPWTDESGNNRVLRAGDTMTGPLAFSYVSDDDTYWILDDHNLRNRSEPGWSHGIRFKFAEAAGSKWSAVAGRATAQYANATALDFYTSGHLRATITNTGLEPAETGTYNIGTSALKWNYVYGNEFSGNAATARKLRSWNVGNVRYETNDTHILRIGYVKGGGYGHVSLLVTSAFWGNQHGSADWLDIQFDNSNAGSLVFTATRRYLGGNAIRKFYTLKSGDNIYIYAYVTGGNSYGRWLVSTVQDSDNAFVSDFAHNVTISGQSEIPYLNPITNLSINGNNLTGAKMDGSTVTVVIPSSGGTTPYTLPLAGNGTRGGVQIGYTQNAQNYPVELSGEKMFVYVPWTDTNTWRPVQDNLTTQSASDCLSAKQGYLLANGSARDSTKRADTAPTSGNWFRGTPKIGSDGVMEIGKYIDFHTADTRTGDYDARITANTTGLTLSGTTVGTFSGSLSGNATTANNGIKNITRSGTTYTVTRYDDSTFTFTQQDKDGLPYNGYAKDTATDFNSVDTVGWYRTDGTTMANAPASYAWGELIVFSYGQWLRASNKMYFRSHTGNPPTYGSWIDVTKDTTYSAGTGLSLSGTTFSVKTGYTTNDRNYKVSADSNGNLYANVPWDDTWRPMTARDTETLPTNPSACLSGLSGYDLAHGWAMDSRMQYFAMAPNLSKSFEIKSDNSAYIIIWRIGSSNSYGIKFGVGDNCIDMMLTGTDNCNVSYDSSTRYVRIKNTHASAHLRGFVFGNVVKGSISE